VVKIKEIFFIKACIKGDCEYICKEINNVDINYTDEIYGKTCLHYACDNMQMNSVILIMTNKHLDINKKDKNGRTAYMLSCYRGDVNIVSILLQHNEIDINLYDNYFSTGFNYACDYGNIDLIKFLMSVDNVYSSRIFHNFSKLFQITPESTEDKIFYNINES